MLKFGWIRSMGYVVMGVLSSGIWLPPNFQRPLAAKLWVRPLKVFEVQERARGPLSPCHVWWGSDFIRRPGGQKNVEIFLSVRHAF